MTAAAGKMGPALKALMESLKGGAATLGKGVMGGAAQAGGGIKDLFQMLMNDPNLKKNLMAGGLGALGGGLIGAGMGAKDPYTDRIAGLAKTNPELYMALFNEPNFM